MQISHISLVVKWILIGTLFLAALALPQWILRLRYASHIFTPLTAPIKPTAVVFGAGLRRDGYPTTVLADRVMTAVALYHEGKVGQILMSGSSQDTRYNEATAMHSLAVKLGIPSEDILIDSGGSRTFQTCLRARHLFGIDQALLVSQRFHLPRALVLCEAIGLSAAGVAADLHSYRAQFLWSLREIPATLRALWEANLIKSQQADLLLQKTTSENEGYHHGS